MSRSRNNQNIRRNEFPLPSVHRNVTRTNEIDIPYTILLSETFEEEPPPYESVVSPFPT
jgi:hypothetical protein